MSDILNSRGGGRTNRAVTADLYIEDFGDGPLFIELKSPLPNLDIAAESKRKILYYLLIMDRKGVEGAQAHLGLTYNPFISREDYAHSYTKQIMDHGAAGADGKRALGHDRGTGNIHRTAGDY